MNEQKERTEAVTPLEPPSKKPGGNRIILIAIIVVVIVLNAVVSFLLIRATKPENDDQKVARLQSDSLKQALEKATTMGATTAEEPIEAIVNIAGTNGERFLKAAVIFEYDDTEFPNLSMELTRRAPKFKDLLINHLSRQTLDDLSETDAKDIIRKDLLRLVNATIPPKIGEIRDVLFTTYIIQ